MTHEQYISRCILIAQRGGKYTKNNPQVGAVLVHNNKIIGEGFHEYFGGPHAEVNCIKNVKDKHLIPDSTLYVSLEPCCITGKTPPCTDLIINSGIKKVVISALDVNPEVNGKSVALLKEKGIHVSTGILRKEGEYLIRKFKVNYLEKRPYIILKIVKSKDNFIGKSGKKIWLSNNYTDIYTHKIRSQNDGIMAGSATVLNDNPSLTTRNYSGDNPVRITLDRNGIIPEEFHFFSKKGRSIYFTSNVRQLPPNIQQVIMNADEFSLKDILSTLYSRGIYSVLVEGGKNLMNAFISEGIWDEAIVISTETKLKNGISAPNINGKLITEYFIATDKIQKIYSGG